MLRTLIIFAALSARNCALVFAQGLLPESPITSSLAGSVVARPDEIPFSLNAAAIRADSALPLRAAVTYSPFVGGLKDASLSAVEGIYYSPVLGTSFSLGITNLSFSDLYSDLMADASIATQFRLSKN